MTALPRVTEREAHEIDVRSAGGEYGMGSEHGMATRGTRSGRRSGRRALATGAAIAGLLIGSAGASSVAAHSFAGPWTTLQGAAVPEKYVLTGSTGATLRNLPDGKEHELLRVGGDTPLAVHPMNAGSGFLKVTVPGGVKVWVFGKYLTESARPGWVEVTGSYVNMRPRPRSSNSYPMGQLDRGDRLRFVQRQDTSKPMSDDWVQVWSPPDTKAYVLAAETRALPAGADAKALWDGAVSTALGAQPVVPVPAGGSAATTNKPVGTVEAGAPQKSGAQGSGAGGGNPPGIFGSLAAANAEMDKALAGPSPDYAKLYANYEAILAMGPDAPTRKLITDSIERINLRRELDEIRADYQQQSAEREQQLAELRDQAEQGQRSHDPLWGRFQTRGWLERQATSGEKIYLVRWGADTLARVQCSSGRYDLDLYDGVEIGVKGVPIRPAAGTAGSYPLIDIDRIEVISIRLRKR